MANKNRSSVLDFELSLIHNDVEHVEDWTLIYPMVPALLDGSQGVFDYPEIWVNEHLSVKAIKQQIARVFGSQPVFLKAIHTTVVYAKKNLNSKGPRFGDIRIFSTNHVVGIF